MTDIGQFVIDYADGNERKGEHYEFECWDVEERSPELLDRLKQDGVLDRIEEYGSAPHLFQSGVIYESPKLGAIFAGNQSGKTKGVIIDLVCACTGEYPHSMRYDKGVDTGVKRSITEANILRFGRQKKNSGALIDHDIRHLNRQDGLWDCGTIMGTGKYPESKRLKDGDVVWVGTLKQARDEHWWPTLKKDIPDHCLDKSKGNGGFLNGSNGRFVVYFNTGVEVHIITYEQGYERFEAAKVPWVILDEEPLSERIFTGVLQRAGRITLVETPYRGMTFTYHRIKKVAKDNPNIVFYHCTQYDSPYKYDEDIAQARSMMPKWEIESRVYGLHSEQVGKPYFHDLFETLQGWLRVHIPLEQRYSINLGQYSNAYEASKMEAVGIPDRAGMWEVYEPPIVGQYYWLSADTARGDDGGDERVDANVATIFRFPMIEKGENPAFPVDVANCRTVVSTKGFARECLSACVWYNCALMAPEAQGFSAGTFINEVHGYPYMYTMSVKDNRTRRDVERIGFNTNTKTRQMIFDEVGEFVSSHANNEFSPIKNLALLREIARLVVGKGGRPDHPRDGTSDSIIAYGIGLYIFKFDKWQCSMSSNNGINAKSKGFDSWGGRATDPNNSRVKRCVFGSWRK